MPLPPSLTWLVRGYARTKGQVERKQRRIGRLRGLFEFHSGFAAKYEAELSAEQALLDAILAEETAYKTALELHEVAVAGTDVVPVRPHDHRYVAGAGGITRAAYRAIQQSPQGKAWTSEIVRAVIEQAGLPPSEHPRVRLRVQVRLCIMAREGRLRALSRTYLADREWALPQGSAMGE